MNIREIFAKRVAGVPVLYIAAAFVVILAVVAWRMKPAVDPVEGDPSAASETPTEGDDPYGSLATQGTVTVVQQAPVTEPVEEDKTNERWARAGAEWIVAHPQPNINATGSTAITALNRYLMDEDLSYEQTAIVNAVIKEKGQPPEGVTGSGKVTNEAPAQKQFSNFPGTHTVKSVNDNTPAKLSTLYYGTADAAHINKLVSANTALGPATGTYNIGSKVVIPVYYNPRMFTITNTTTWPSQVAAKNGITYQQFLALNPGLVAPYKVGSKVRVL